MMEFAPMHRGSFHCWIYLKLQEKVNKIRTFIPHSPLLIETKIPLTNFPLV
jgi:hypothetical protein